MEQLELEKNAVRVVNIARIVGLALMVTIFLYPAIAASAIAAAGRVGINAEPPPLGLIEGLIAFAVICLVLAKRIGRIPLASLKPNAAGSVDTGKIPALWLSSVIIEMALRDVPANVGLALSLLTGTENWCIFLGLASFFAIGFNWPKPEKLAAVLSKTA